MACFGIFFFILTIYSLSHSAVSQVDALKKLEDQNFQVVGWYHSHPSFSPQPSVRDIETQTDYQRMFNVMTPENTGGRPYVAFILSPFMVPDEKTIQSQLKPKNSFQLHEPPQFYKGKRFYAADKVKNFSKL